MTLSSDDLQKRALIDNTEPTVEISATVRTGNAAAIPKHGRRLAEALPRARRGVGTGALGGGTRLERDRRTASRVRGSFRHPARLGHESLWPTDGCEGGIWARSSSRFWQLSLSKVKSKGSKEH